MRKEHALIFKPKKKENNIYLVKRKDEVDYDEYESFVVVAGSMQEATNYHPNGKRICIKSRYAVSSLVFKDWVKSKSDLRVTQIGKTTRRKGVVTSSFNAG